MFIYPIFETAILVVTYFLFSLLFAAIGATIVVWISTKVFHVI